MNSSLKPNSKYRKTAIIQARMGSTRLPGKVLMEAAGFPLIIHMLRRVKRCKHLDSIWLATSKNPENDRLEKVVAEFGFPVFRGEEDDVLSRYYAVAKEDRADIVVRLTGDCPLHDPGLIDQMMAQFEREHVGNYDVMTNAQRPSFPDGLDTEIMTMRALTRAYENGHDTLEREHVTAYFLPNRKGGQEFKVFHFRGEEDLSHLRWTLDRPEDYELIKQIFEELYPKNPEFDRKDILELLKMRPELATLNTHIVRNEGFKP